MRKQLKHQEQIHRSRRERKSSRTPRIVFASLLMTAIIVAIGLLTVWSRLESVRLGYQITEQAKLNHNLIQENRRLRIEAAELKRPIRVLSLVRERLGLHLPQKGQVIEITETQGNELALIKK